MACKVGPPGCTSVDVHKVSCNACCIDAHSLAVREHGWCTASWHVELLYWHSIQRPRDARQRQTGACRAFICVPSYLYLLTLFSNHPSCPAAVQRHAWQSGVCCRACNRGPVAGGVNVSVNEELSYTHACMLAHGRPPGTGTTPHTFRQASGATQACANFWGRSMKPCKRRRPPHAVLRRTDVTTLTLATDVTTPWLCTCFALLTAYTA